MATPLGGTDFFLNIAVIDDFVAARSTTTHELYHAVQGAYAAERGMTFRSGGEAAAACSNVEKLFSSLYEEGTARYVEDFSSLGQSKSVAAQQILADTNEGIGHARTAASLLEMSVTALSSPVPTTFDDVYDVGFLGHGELYGIGYLMARAIVASDGPQGLVVLLKRPPYRFILRYSQLTDYGSDEEHPLLGPNVMSAAHKLEAGCR